MAFKLAANIDSSFSSTFTEASNTITQLSKDLQKLNDTQEQLGEWAQVEAWENIADTLKIGLEGVFTAYKECISVAGDFQETMSAVEAISGATSDELEQLSAKAKELGATTKFTATESAEAMTYMAQAGWTAEEMLQGMDGVIMLAAAGGQDLASTTSIVADSLAAFGLTANDTARFADILAMAAARSNTNVELMGETFQTAAPVAGALGFHVEDVAVAMGLMANNGIKGSRAGTTLRNIFNGMAQKITLTSNAFGELEYNTMNADGSMKSFSEVIRDLRGYFDQMTGAEQVANAQNIATMRGYAGFLAILNSTEEDFNDLTEAINNSTGAAQKMANTKLDNFNGQVVIMQSAWDAVKTTIGETFLPVLQKLATGMAGVLTSVNDFLKAHPNLIKAVTAFVSVMGLAVGALTAYAAVKKTIAVLDLVSVFTSPIGAIMGTVAAVAALTAAVVAFVDTSNGADVDGLNDSIKGLSSAMETTAKDYNSTVHEITGTESLALEYLGTLERLEEQGIHTKEEQAEYNRTVEKLRYIMPDLNIVLDEQRGLIIGGASAIKEQVAAWKELAQQEAMQKKFQAQIEAYADAELEYAIAAGKANVAEQELAVEEDKLIALGERRRIAGERIAELEGKTTALTRDEEIELNNLRDTTTSLIDEEVQQGKVVEAAQKKVNDYKEAMTDAKEVMDENEQQINEAQNALDEYNKSQETGTEHTHTYANSIDDLNGVIEETFEQVEKVTEEYQKTYEAAYKSISGQYALWDKAAEVVAVDGGEILKNLQGQAAYWNDYNTNLNKLSDLENVIPGLSTMLSSFADGSEESVNAIAGLAKMADKGNIDGLTEIVNQWFAVKQAQDETAESITDLSIDLDAELENIIANTAEKIGELDMSEETKQMGLNTIQGFIDGAEDPEKMQAVIAAFRRVGEGAANALGESLDIHSPSRVMRELAGYTWAGFIEGTEDAENAVINAMTDTINSGIDTSSGLQVTALHPALVGAMNSLASPVEAIQSGGGEGSSYAVNVSFNIEGNADSGTVGALENFGEDFASRVRAVIEEVRDDENRRAYY